MSQCSTVVYKRTSELRKPLYQGLKVRSQSVLNREAPVYYEEMWVLSLATNPISLLLFSNFHDRGVYRMVVWSYEPHGMRCLVWLCDDCDAVLFWMHFRYANSRRTTETMSTSSWPNMPKSIQTRLLSR